MVSLLKNWRKKNKKNETFLQCDPEEAGACDAGCGGGLMNSAFEYILKAGGLEREEDYPYTGKDRGPCKFQNGKVAASVSNFSVISTDADQVAANLLKNGPLAGNQFLVPILLVICISKCRVLIDVVSIKSLNLSVMIIYCSLF